MANAIFQATDQNILRAATWVGTAPATGSSLTSFARLDPAVRVVYDATSATVSAIIASARGDILAIPCTNATGLVVRNDTGMNVSVPVPELPASKIPLTLVCDLSLLEPNAATRTSAVWHFDFSSSSTLVLGAAIALYTPRRELLVGDVQWGGSSTRTGFGNAPVNDTGIRYLWSAGTLRRSISVTKLGFQADVTALQDWYDASWGPAGAVLWWPDPDVNDGYLGTLATQLDVKRVGPTVDGPVFSVGIQVVELAKGRPVLGIQQATL